MRELAPYDYRVLLIGSERDHGWIAWLQQTIECYRVDRDLTGRPTPYGPVPVSLRPVFRDSDGPALSDAARAALDGSRFLLVVCSPHSARRAAVDEAIRHFFMLGRADRVIPVIVGGRDSECLPPSLRPDLGGLRGIEVRPQPGSKTRAGHRVIARLTGVDADEIAVRHVRAQQRRINLRRGIAAGLISLVLVGEAGGVLLPAMIKSNEAWLDAALSWAVDLTGSAVEVARDIGLPAAVTAKLLGNNELQLRALAALGPDKARRDRRRAVMLVSVARHYAALGEVERQTARTREADALLQQLAAIPDIAEWQLALGEGAYPFGDVISAVDKTGGESGHDRASRAAALQELRVGLAAARRRAAADPGRLARQRELALAHERVGDALREEGDLAGALEQYQAERTILARLAAGIGTGKIWQYDLGRVHAHIAFVQEARGNFSAALRSYEACREIDARFVAEHPDKTGWRRDLAVSHGKLAAVHHRLGHAAMALAEWRKGRAILAALVAAEPEFEPWTAELAQFDDRIAALEGRANVRRAAACSEECMTLAADLGTPAPAR